MIQPLFSGVERRAQVRAIWREFLGAGGSRRRGSLRALGAGDLFLFKLHPPDNFIASRGVFAYRVRLGGKVVPRFVQSRAAVLGDAHTSLDSPQS